MKVRAIGLAAAFLLAAAFPLFAGHWSAPSAAAAEYDCPVGQFRGEYFNNPSLSGSPVLSRCDAQINFDWGTGSPGSPVGSDNFSVRWTGLFSLSAANTGGTDPQCNYEFTAVADDGIRVWVNNNLILDQWVDQAPTTYRKIGCVSGGANTRIKVEYYERGGGAVAKLSWPCQCVEFVKMKFKLDGALTAFGSATGGAKDMGTYLERKGFTKVNTPIDGAVVVLQTGAGGAGHAAGSVGHVGVMVGPAIPSGSNYVLSLRSANFQIRGETRETELSCNNVTWQEITVPQNGQGVVGYYVQSGTPTSDVQLTSGQPLASQAVGNKAWRYYWINVPSGASQLQVQTTAGSGDADLYLKQGSKPTVEVSDRKSAGNTSSESVSVSSPGGGTWWVGVYGFSAATYSVVATVSTAPPPLADTALTSGQTLNNQGVNSGQWRYYYISVGSGASQLQVRTTAGSGDADLYLKLGSKPNGSEASKSTGGTSSETVSISNPGAGTWWVGVFGYSTATYSIVGTVSTAPARSEVIVDDTSSGFVRGGTAAYWYQSSIGYGGHMWYTGNRKSGVDDWAKWTPRLGGAGNYEVYVWIPRDNASSTNAGYRIHHNGVDDGRRINQYNYSDTWVSIGTYYFNAASDEYVFMGDETYETSSTRKVGFDAVKFVPR